MITDQHTTLWTCERLTWLLSKVLSVQLDFRLSIKLLENNCIVFGMVYSKSGVLYEPYLGSRLPTTPGFSIGQPIHKLPKPPVTAYVSSISPYNTPRLKPALRMELCCAS